MYGYPDLPRARARGGTLQHLPEGDGARNSCDDEAAKAKGIRSAWDDEVDCEDGTVRVTDYAGGIMTWRLEPKVAS